MASAAPRFERLRGWTHALPFLGGKRDRVLARYAGGNRAGSLRYLWYALFFLAVAAYGFIFAVYGRYYLVPILMPIVLIAGLTLWVLPQTEAPPVVWLERLFWIFIVASLTWPDYLALALPGVPWISATRLTTAPLALMLLVCLSVSQRFRAAMLDTLSAGRSIVVLLAIFLVTAVVSLPLSGDLGSSINKFVTAQFNWTAIFFVALFVFALPKRATYFAYLLWGITLFIVAVAVWEARYEMVPWRNHIPSFLQIEDPRVLALISGIERAGTGAYRVQSRFNGSISLGEYLALVTPLLLHLMATSKRIWVRVGVLATLPVIVYVDYVTRSRSALIGFAVSVICYGLFWAYLNWRRRPGSLMAVAMLAAFPMGAGAFGVAVLAFGRIRKIFLGGGAEQSSTDARATMYQMAVPKILENPLGVGMGRGGPELGFLNPVGMLTIDTYYVAVILEYGIIGFFAYYGAFLAAIILGLRAALRTADREIEIAGAVAIALINFVIIKSVYSQQENHSLVFALLGMMVALLWREREERREREGMAVLPARSGAALLEARA